MICGVGVAGSLANSGGRGKSRDHGKEDLSSGAQNVVWMGEAGDSMVYSRVYVCKFCERVIP